jgi:hypothetical protein
LEPLRNKKTLYSTRACVNWAFFGTRGPLKRPFHSRFKLAHSCQKKPNLHMNSLNNSYLFNEFVCNFGFFWHEWTSLKGPRVPKKAKITQERVEYNVFLFDEPLKGSKSLKIFKISLTMTFRFDKLSNLSKSVHTGENSQILTVSKKNYYFSLFLR